MRIAVTNQKGGVAKSTTVVNLAGAIAETGRSVLVIDLDAQADATRWLDAKPGESDVLSVLLREATVDEAVVPCVVPGIEVLPATSELAGAERSLSSQVGIELRLRTALARARPRDVVLIDCPPSLGLQTVGGLAAAETVLVPVVPGVLELHAVAALAETVDQVADALAPGLAIGHILVSAATPRTRIDRDVVASLRRRFPDQLMKTVITRSTRLREAAAARKPITVWDPGSGAAEQFRAAAAELLGTAATAATTTPDTDRSTA